MTFVFSVYLTGSVGVGLGGDTSPASWLGRALAVAGVVVAVLAPATGVWVQAPLRRRATLTTLTAAANVAVASARQRGAAVRSIPIVAMAFGIAKGFGLEQCC